MFVVGAVPNAQARQCSNASLEGAYGFLDGHILVPAGTPFAGLGRWNFDGRGNFTSTLTINDNGTAVSDEKDDRRLRGHGQRFGTTRVCFSTASVSRPSAGATASLLSAVTGQPRS